MTTYMDERLLIVEWLRKRAETLRAEPARFEAEALELEMVADAIEAGDHLN